MRGFKYFYKAQLKRWTVMLFPYLYGSDLFSKY